MTIRAVDLQIVVQKATEVMKNQQQENSKTRLLMHQQAQQLQKKEQIANHQITNLQKPDKSAIYKEKERKNKRESSGEERKNKKEQMAKEHDGDSIIDILI